MAATSAEDPWWEKEPAQWLDNVERQQATVIYPQMPEVHMNGSVWSAVEYVNRIFQNNYNNFLNKQKHISPGVWRSQHIHAMLYKWEGDRKPRHRRYQVTFPRCSFLTKFADGAIDARLGESEEVVTTWNEVSLGVECRCLLSLALHGIDTFDPCASSFTFGNVESTTTRSWQMRRSCYERHLGTIKTLGGIV